MKYRASMMVCMSAISLMLMLSFVGCKDDDEGGGPPAGFTLSPATVTVASAGSGSVSISGGTSPYSIQTGPDTTVARATLSGSTISVTGVASGYTSVIVRDAANATLTLNVVVSGAITADLFPVVAGRHFIYAGHAISTSGTVLSDPSKVYNTIWTIGPPYTPIPGSTVLVDTTTLNHPTAGVIGVKRNLIFIKNATTGDFTFAQTLGPLFRAFNIQRTDTVRLVTIARPSVGIGNSWTAFDETFSDTGGAQIRLQIFGQVEAGEVITDSSTSHSRHETVRFRTYRKISVNNATVVDNATTSRLWLAKNVGPVQVLIAQDTENLGHFRVLKHKNF